MGSDWFAQTPFRVRLDWGRRGAKSAAERGDILVVVDALCFSTAVALAVSRGATIILCKKGEATAERAALFCAELAIHRDHVPARGRFSLSPGTLRAVTPGTRILLASLNGATCAQYGAAVPALFVGAFVNAEAVANAVSLLLAKHPGTAVTVLACGERWQEPDADDGNLRFAIEDFLAAGAILSHLPDTMPLSPEAKAAVAAFDAAHGSLLPTLRECGSGIELIGRGFPADVDEAAALNTIAVAPVLRDGGFHRL
ncbi:MAG: 2-phosphosulfolactate phosphatase [Akkermansiaceae bacterium]|nr:2-phosphosulfolactate phosphatase [Armatimonadota bacterium]